MALVSFYFIFHGPLPLNKISFLLYRRRYYLISLFMGGHSEASFFFPLFYLAGFSFIFNTAKEIKWKDKKGERSGEKE